MRTNRRGLADTLHCSTGAEWGGAKTWDGFGDRPVWLGTRCAFAVTAESEQGLWCVCWNCEGEGRRPSVLTAGMFADCTAVVHFPDSQFPCSVMVLLYENDWANLWSSLQVSLSQQENTSSTYLKTPVWSPPIYSCLIFWGRIIVQGVDQVSHPPREKVSGWVSWGAVVHIPLEPCCVVRCLLFSLCLWTRICDPRSHLSWEILSIVWMFTFNSPNSGSKYHCAKSFH